MSSPSKGPGWESQARQAEGRGRGWSTRGDLQEQGLLLPSLPIQEGNALTPISTLPSVEVVGIG